MKPLRIAVVAFPTHGGSGVIGFDSAYLLAKRGHSVSFVSSEYPFRARGSVSDEEHDFGIVTVETKRKPDFGPEAYAWALSATLIELHAKRAIDVIHAHYAIPHALSVALVRETLGLDGPRLVTTLHGTDVTQQSRFVADRRLTAWALDRCDALVAPSDWLKATAIERFGSDVVRNCVVAGNFVDLNRFAVREMTRPMRIVHVSNLRPIKRGLDVIEVFERAKSSVAELELDVVGDGPDLNAMVQRASTGGLNRSIRFWGGDGRVAERIGGACAFLLPSESESFGLAALEAMACGVPVVGTRVGGMPEVVRDGDGGFLHALGDVDAMAADVIRLCSDTELQAIQSRAARARAVKIGQAEPIIDRYEQLYQSLVAS